MSSRRSRSTAMACSLSVLAVVLSTSPRPLWGIEIDEIPLSFGPDASERGLVTSLAGVDSLAGAGQFVLELTVQALGLPADDDLILELLVVGNSESGEVELLNSVDLFAAGEIGEGWHVLFDLSPLATLDSLPCPLEGSALRLLPVDKSVRIFAEEGSNARLQVVRF